MRENISKMKGYNHRGKEWNDEDHSLIAFTLYGVLEHINRNVSDISPAYRFAKDNFEKIELDYFISQDKYGVCRLYNASGDVVIVSNDPPMESLRDEWKEAIDTRLYHNPLEK